MRNMFMRGLRAKKELVDVSGCKRTKQGDYILPKRLLPTEKNTKDYANTKTEMWIWSIGQRGDLVVASEQSKFYGRRGWKCIWLR